MNFSSDSPHSITYCGHILININRISLVGKDSSVRRKKSHSPWGLTRCQTRYLHFTSNPHNEPVSLVLLVDALTVTGVAEARRHDHGVQGARARLESSSVRRPAQHQLASFPQHPGLCSFSNVLSAIVLGDISFPPSFTYTVWVGLAPLPLIEGWLFQGMLRNEHMDEADPIRDITHTLEESEISELVTFPSLVPPSLTYMCALFQPCFRSALMTVSLRSLTSTHHCPPWHGVAPVSPHIAPAQHGSLGFLLTPLLSLTWPIWFYHCHPTPDSGCHLFLSPKLTFSQVTLIADILFLWLSLAL